MLKSPSSHWFIMKSTGFTICLFALKDDSDWIFSQSLLYNQCFSVHDYNTRRMALRKDSQFYLGI